MFNINWVCLVSVTFLGGQSVYDTESGRVHFFGLGFDLDNRKRDGICMAVRPCKLDLRYLVLILGRMRRCIFKWFYFYFRYILLGAQM